MKHIKNFEKGAPHYHEEAAMQIHCAKQLAHYIGLHRHRITTGPILEIGCGTGFVTAQLLQLFANRPLHITDISAGMVDFCRNKISRPHSQISFGILDGENPISSQKYALIASGMTFQWFKKMEQAVDKLLKFLKPKGFIFFSFLEAQSFPEWRRCTQELSLPYTANPLPDMQVQKSLQPRASFWNESLIIKYPNAADFFRHLKRIGVGTSLQKPLSSHQMRRLLSHWDAKCPEGISVTYEIAYAMIVAEAF